MTISDKSRFEELKASGLLPSPKGVALAVMRLAQDDNTTIAEMARTIKADPALSGRIVKAANTVQFGGRRPVASIPDALMVLGLATVRQLALGFSLVSEYRSGRCEGFGYDAFWSRSLVTALAMQGIVTRVRVAVPEECFLLGLLSRVGCLALATVFPEEYGELLRAHPHASVNELTFLEKQTFATDHNELTAELLADWGLPKVLVEPARHHEDPARGKFQPGSRCFVLAHALNLATYLADVCLAPQAARSALLPNLFLLGTRIALDAEKVTAIADEAIVNWEEWSRLLEVPPQPVRSLADLAAAAEAAEDPVRVPLQAAGKAKLRILVVDDDKSVLMMLEKVLTNAGYRVFTAANGREALHTAMECRPQLIVADWLMPEMDGLEFCRALRNTKIGRGVYMVLLTGVEDDARLVEAFEAGVDDYVLKPINPKMLLARLRAGERVVRLQNEVESDREQIRRVAAELAMSNRRLQEAALLDPLTGIPNRRYAMDRIQQEWSAAERAGRPLACMLIDVDHFKRINDTHGHDVGDLVLQRVAEVLKQTARTQDVICRIGGEEFLVVCPDADASAAAQCAERLRQAVNAMRIEVAASTLQITISVGVAAMEPAMTGPESMIKAADQAVYAAKQAGRNRICIYRARAAAPAVNMAANA
ncbi:MAG TPA: diguanylate cyclase [Burkholderiales bacterium]